MLQESCIGNEADVTFFDHPRLARCILAPLTQTMFTRVVHTQAPVDLWVFLPRLDVSTIFASECSCGAIGVRSCAAGEERSGLQLPIRNKLWATHSWNHPGSYEYLCVYIGQISA